MSQTDQHSVQHQTLLVTKACATYIASNRQQPIIQTNCESWVSTSRDQSLCIFITQYLELKYFTLKWLWYNMVGFYYYYYYSWFSWTCDVLFWGVPPPPLAHQLLLWGFPKVIVCICTICRCLWGPVNTQSSTICTGVNVGKWDSPDLSTSRSRELYHCLGPQHTKTGMFLLCFCH